MSTHRLPWFKCNAGKLLGALAGMEPDEALIYVTTLLRIYETGGPIDDVPRVLSRRTGMGERRVERALAALVERRKITIEAGVIDSISTHETLTEMKAIQNAGKKGGITSAEKRKEKIEEKQPKIATPVEPSFDGGSTIRDLDREERQETLNQSSSSCSPAREGDDDDDLKIDFSEAERRCSEAAGCHPANFAPIKEFLRKGVDLETRILPKIRTMAEANRKSGKDAPATWNYFAGGISEAVTQSGAQPAAPLEFAEVGTWKYEMMKATIKPPSLLRMFTKRYSGKDGMYFVSSHYPPEVRSRFAPAHDATPALATAGKP